MVLDQLHTHGDKAVKHVIDAVIVAGLPFSLFETVLDPFLKWSGWTELYPPLAVIWIVFRITETQKYRSIKKQILSWFDY